MKVFRLSLAVLLLPLAAFAAEHSLKVDKTRSFVDVDVDSTVNFTAHLDAYDAKLTVDDAGKIKTAVFTFRFTDLKTGNAERDAKMIAWLGGGIPEGRFEMGNLAVTPDGQGQVSGRLTFHGVTERVEFPISITRGEGISTIVGETTLDYRPWNLKPIRKALLFKVGAEVKIRFKLTAVPAAEPAK